MNGTAWLGSPSDFENFQGARGKPKLRWIILWTIAESNLDPVHLFYVRILGGVLLGQTVCWAVSLTTHDRAVFLSLFSARTFGGVVLVMVVFFDHQGAAKDHQPWSKQHLYVGLPVCGLWFLGSAKQLFQCGPVSSGTVQMTDRLSRHLLLDLLIQVPYALMCFGYQDLEFEIFELKSFNPDGIHRHILRCVSVMVFTTALHGIGALYFQNKTGRHAYFLGQLTTQVLVAVTCAFSQWNFCFWPRETVVIVFSAMVLPTFNLVLASCFRDKQKNN